MALDQRLLLLAARIGNEFKALRSLGLATVTSATTLSLSHARSLVNVLSASSVAITVPTADVVAFPLGTQIILRQTGVGQVTVQGTGVTFQSPASLKTRTQYSTVMLIKVDTNTWSVSGDLE